MSKFERYWIHASIFLLLAGSFSQSITGLVGSTVSYLFAFGYFCAMVWTTIKGESQ